MKKPKSPLNTVINLLAFMLITLFVVFVLAVLEKNATIREFEAEIAELEAHIEFQEGHIIRFEGIAKDMLNYLERCDFELLIMAVIEVESGGDANAIGIDKSGQRNIGLMQVKDGSLGSIQNVISGSRMLANLIARSVNEHLADSSKEIIPVDILHRALTAYNRGWSGANRYKARTGKFNSEYSEKVLKQYREFKEQK